MNFLQRIGAGIMAGITTFVETSFSSDVRRVAAFESYTARQLRYSVNWAYYENNQYSEAVHAWAASKKSAVPQLYKHIRSIYNPVGRDAAFWQSAIWRGSLSPDAGPDGAIPVAIGEKADEKKLRPAIAKVNAWSNWNANKDIHVLHGAVKGDAVIYIRKDDARGQVRNEILDPSELKSVVIDDMGYVKSFAIEYPRIDNDGKPATYREECEHGEGTLINFFTFRDGVPYAWDGNENADKGQSSWSAEWGFVPLVLTQHKNIGLDFGVSEFHATTGKIDEINDIASLLNDQVRKLVNPPWLYTGTKRFGSPAKTATTPTYARPEPGREEAEIIDAGENGSATAMVAPVDIMATLSDLDRIQKEIEDDLPELKQEVWSGGAGPSDSTILAARGRVEGLVQQRRAGYDTGYVRAVQMAITMSGMAGYDGFAGYNVGSYKSGALDFSVMERPAFPPQPSETRAETAEFWAGWAPLEGGSIPFRVYAMSHGKTAEWVDDFDKMRGVKQMEDKTAVGL